MFLLSLNIDILGVFAEKPYRKSLECNVVYIPITTSSCATLIKSKKTWRFTVVLDIDNVMQFAEKLHADVQLPQF